MTSKPRNSLVEIRKLSKTSNLQTTISKPIRIDDRSPKTTTAENAEDELKL